MARKIQETLAERCVHPKHQTTAARVLDHLLQVGAVTGAGAENHGWKSALIVIAEALFTEKTRPGETNYNYCGESLRYLEVHDFVVITRQRPQDGPVKGNFITKIALKD